MGGESGERAFADPYDAVPGGDETCGLRGVLVLRAVVPVGPVEFHNDVPEQHVYGQFAAWRRCQPGVVLNGVQVPGEDMPQFGIDPDFELGCCGQDAVWAAQATVSAAVYGRLPAVPLRA